MSDLSVCLWFDDQAEQAAEFYVAAVPGSKILGATRFPEGLPKPTGSVMMVRFLLDGVEFTALNGGPEFKPTPAISIALTCETQAEVDSLWSALTDGGEEVQCGWLTDRFGVSWQVIPAGLSELLGSSDAEASARAVAAMLPMKKLDIEALRRAYNGE
jgi:predicted 3-demethylubiquinone-9 3-methyltransferase (glyoxalase superfamily)